LSEAKGLEQSVAGEKVESVAGMPGI